MTGREDLHPGDIIHIGPGSGVAVKEMTARLIRVNNWSAWDGMAWLDVHELDQHWQAVEERMAYVCLAGVTVVRTAAEAAAGRRRVLRAARLNDPPAAARIPKPRPSPETTTGRNR